MEHGRCIGERYQLPKAYFGLQQTSNCPQKIFSLFSLFASEKNASADANLLNLFFKFVESKKLCEQQKPIFERVLSIVMDITPEEMENVTCKTLLNNARKEFLFYNNTYDANRDYLKKILKKEVFNWAMGKEIPKAQELFENMKADILSEFSDNHWTRDNDVVPKFLAEIRNLKLVIPNYWNITQLVIKWENLEKECNTNVSGLGESFGKWYVVVCQAYASSGLLEDSRNWLKSIIPSEVFEEYEKDEKIMIAHGNQVIATTPLISLSAGTSKHQLYGGLGFWFLRHMIRKLDFAALSRQRKDISAVLGKNQKCVLYYGDFTNQRHNWFHFNKNETDIGVVTNDVYAIAREATYDLYALGKAWQALHKYFNEPAKECPDVSSPNEIIKTPNQIFFISAGLLLLDPGNGASILHNIRHTNLEKHFFAHIVNGHTAFFYEHVQNVICRSNASKIPESYFGLQDFEKCDDESSSSVKNVSADGQLLQYFFNSAEAKLLCKEQRPIFELMATISMVNRSQALDNQYLEDGTCEDRLRDAKKAFSKADNIYDANRAYLLKILKRAIFVSHMNPDRISKVKHMFKTLKDIVIKEFYTPYWIENNTAVPWFLLELKEMDLQVPNYAIITESMEKWLKMAKLCENTVSELGEQFAPWRRVICETYGSSGLLNDIHKWLVVNIPRKFLKEFEKDDGVWIDSGKILIPQSIFFTLASGETNSQLYGSLGFWMIKHMIHKLDLRFLGKQREDMADVFKKNKECVLSRTHDVSVVSLVVFSWRLHLNTTELVMAIVTKARENAYALRTAWREFKKHSPNSVTASLNNTRTPEQMFFYSAAAVLFGPLHANSENGHFTHREVNLMMIQMAQFAETFDCPRREMLGRTSECTPYTPAKRIN
ncbi:unnamed protein product [Caenorhabditis sp. 36 PRJEB53466]|nr:unnamed protein product [Caenorhabditis sp. 36 PRJEB53466]